ncbi:TPM domain-containing protein [Treponema pedis]|uniref:TPM domain-containing protein n=1 Tax=Treponema pedis TaxID=409322 RepID=A0A7S7AWW6_9SPIR|nr:TPM domain-containing protein [Treponema pedis]QOW60526.1 TPM domain-containing protein [Treponema pedis]
MVTEKFSLSFFICLFFLFAVIPVFGKELLVDNEGILTADEAAEITDYLKKVSEKSKSDTVIVIVSETGGKTPEEFADDYFDYNGYGQGPEKEGSLLLFVTGNGTSGSRHVHISTHGEKTIFAITDSRIEKLLDTVIDGGLKDGEYKAAFNAYIKRLSGYFYNSLSFMEVAVSLAVGLMMFFAKFFGTQSSYKAKKVQAFYNTDKNAVARFNPVKDVFLSTNTVSRIIPKSNENSSSGKSSTHTSSSGESHGGGGRSF